jgi:hypothetical protein
MKTSRLFLIALLLSSCFSNSIQAKDSNRFNLELDDLVPKLGEETEKTIKTSQNFSVTNDLKNSQLITNMTSVLDLKFKDKILLWDESNDMAKVEMMMDRFIYAHNNKTNELVKAGTRLVELT